VRALAILGVIAYHLGMGRASGGYLGVVLFFVLSGFLVTSLLLEAKSSSGAHRAQCMLVEPGPTLGLPGQGGSGSLSARRPPPSLFARTNPGTVIAEMDPDVRGLGEFASPLAPGIGGVDIHHRLSRAGRKTRLA
jgi:hypothetical protein